MLNGFCTSWWLKRKQFGDNLDQLNRKATSFETDGETETFLFDSSHGQETLSKSWAEVKKANDKRIIAD